MQKEIWKRIKYKDVKDIYEISNLGNVRSIDRIVKNIGGTRHIKEKYLKKSISGGYYSVSLMGNKTRRISRYVHLLMKDVFLKESELLIDHINGNSLDNRLNNLRLATSSQNNQNRKPQGKTSKYKGVHFKNKSWHVRLFLKGRYMLSKSCKSEIEAARLYNEYALKYFGVFAYLNILD